MRKSQWVANGPEEEALCLTEDRSSSQGPGEKGQSEGVREIDLVEENQMWEFHLELQKLCDGEQQNFVLASDR